MHRGGWALAFVLMACGSGAGSPPKSPDEPPASPVVINLERAESYAALSALSELLEEPVLVDAMSLAWLRCITVTIREPAPLPRKVAAEKLFDALRAQGVRIERLTYSKRDGATWMVKLDGRPASCPVPEGEIPGASEAAADAGVASDAGAATDASASPGASGGGDAGA